MSKITIASFANDRSNVVVFFGGVACPAGDYAPLGDMDFDFAERRGLLDLYGTVDESGSWQWDGQGCVSDDCGNTIYRVTAYVDAQKWAALTGRPPTLELCD